MIEVVGLYLWSWLAAVLAAGALSLVGALWASRHQAVQALSVSQGAALGVVIGLSLTHNHGVEAETALSFWPTLVGVFTSAAVFLICERLVSRRWTSRNTYFVGMFAVLFSLTYLVIALSPGLESHMASAFFGDISVASNLEAQIIAILGAVSLVFLLGHWRKLVSISFDLTMFNLRPIAGVWMEWLFVVVSLLLITCCVQFLGLLFSLSCLFLPVIALVHGQRRLKGLSIQLVLSSAVGVSMGLVGSLIEGTIPTSPAVTVALVVVMLVWQKGSSFFFNAAKQPGSINPPWR